LQEFEKVTSMLKYFEIKACTGPLLKLLTSN